MENRQKEWLLLDSSNVPLCLAETASERGEPLLRLRLPADAVEEVASHSILGLAWPNKQKPLAQYRMKQCSGHCVSLEKLAFEDQDLREILWVSVNFDSFLYFSKGRIPIRFVELGCCAATFYGEEVQIEGDAEIALPFSAAPIVVRCRVRQQKRLEKKRALYAVEFVDLCEDEETAITEGVFALQRQNRQNRAGV